MSFSIRDVVRIDRPQLPTIFAFRADIHTVFLEWLDLSALQRDFPSRITIDGSMVSFKGPVCIFPDPAAFKTTLIKTTLIALVIVAVFTLLYNLPLEEPSDRTHIAPYDAPPPPPYSPYSDSQKKIIGIALTVLASATMFYIVSRIPNKPGVYFL